MTWSISASGSKDEAKAQLAQAKVNPESQEAAVHQSALDFAKVAVDAALDGSQVSISASGHSDKASEPGGQSQRSYASISFSASMPVATGG